MILVHSLNDNTLMNISKDFYFTRILKILKMATLFATR
jgi:hypothetical protein